MKRVLLVDDHDLFRQVLAVILQQHTDLKENLQAESLAQAREVLDALGGEVVDLAIVDLDLREGDPTELIERLREVEVPVLAFTAWPSLGGRARALRAGAGEVLSTATSGEEIVETAKRLVSASS
jgi:DNA-binding NarL/FixJ family response regulator